MGLSKTDEQWARNDFRTIVIAGITHQKNRACQGQSQDAITPDKALNGVDQTDFSKTRNA